MGDRPELQSHLCHLLIRMAGVDHFTSLRLHFPSCKNGITTCLSGLFGGFRERSRPSVGMCSVLGAFSLSLCNSELPPLTALLSGIHIGESAVETVHCYVESVCM